MTTAELPATTVLRQLVAVGKPPWRRLALAVLLGVAGAMATVGLLAGSGYVVDRAAFRPGLGAIAGVLAAVEVLAFLRGPLRYGERLVAHDAAFRSLARWRVWLYDRLEPLAPAGLGAWRSGDLLSRATDDVDTLQDLYLRGLLPVAVTTAAGVLAVVIVAVMLPLAGLVLGLSLLVAVVGAPVMALATGPARGHEAKLRGELAADVVDLLHGVPDLLAFGREGDLLEQVETADRELTGVARRRARTDGATTALVMVCLGAAVVGVLAAGVAAVRSHHLDPVMLGVLPLAAVGAFETVPVVGLAALRTGEVVAAGRRLLALSAVPVPVSDPPDPEHLDEEAGCPGVEVRGARLRYGTDLPWVLDGLDLDLEPAGRLAIVGSSGAGKSSLVHALLRFWPLQEGTARVGGVPVDRLRQVEVRRTLALVDQDAHLFAGTIRQNVALARPRASDDEVSAAVRLAQLETWVDTLPQGLDTPVGEQGARISGGQRQRIALARALLAGGPVLVLDEPTAGLDRAAGARLLADVRAAAAAEHRGLLLVTHRQEDLVGFDEVVVMEAGRAGPALPDA
ncbi:MAG TPA: thiol reductant ABC exporter subunit CydC [Acidimicrobiales bacterium]|nr:thiol reductant ABC exporter subunit CydC [Acidimicrobiales bacterium]